MKPETQTPKTIAAAVFFEAIQLELKRKRSEKYFSLVSPSTNESERSFLAGCVYTLDKVSEMVTWMSQKLKEGKILV